MILACWLSLESMRTKKQSKREGMPREKEFAWKKSARPKKSLSKPKKQSKREGMPREKEFAWKKSARPKKSLSKPKKLGQRKHVRPLMLQDSKLRQGWLKKIS